MRRLVLFTIGLLLLCLATTAPAEQLDKAVHKNLRQLSQEVADEHSFGTQTPENYLRPQTNMQYKLTTYVGIDCELPHEVIRMSLPVARYAWDFESDGVIDWESRNWEIARHAYDKEGSYYATFYAFDILGGHGRAEISVEVLSGSGQPKTESNALKLSLTGVDERNKKTTFSVFPDPEKRYFLLIADHSDDWLWTPIVNAYHRLVDSLGATDEEIIVVAGAATGFPDYTSYLEDTVIVDYRYTSYGVDSAFNYLLANMTVNDDLHIVSSAHGGGRYDEDVFEFDPQLAYRAYRLAAGRISTEGDDPDHCELEQDFKLAIQGWQNDGVLETQVGLNEWAAVWIPSENGRHTAWRTKRVAKFTGMKFVGSRIKKDSDVFVETIKQTLEGDKDRNGYINPDRKEVWDYDGDGIPPIDTVDGEYVYDEDDWGDYELLIDNSDSSWSGGNIYFDENFDDEVDICYDCMEFFPNPVAHATDFGNDGILDRCDLNRDGDWSDYVGIDGWAFKGYDDDVAEFIDNLQYRYVTVTMQNCFSGEFIDDLSRPNLAIATSTVDGTLAWGTGFESAIYRSLTGGLYTYEDHFPPAEDRVVTLLEAYNEICNRGYTVGGRVRFDDNGDGVGHLCPLPDEGDGALADELCWGTLPPPDPRAPKPVLIWPAQDDWTYNVYPTFIWSDTADADSFKVQWGNEDFSVYGSGVTYDTFFTVPTHVSPLPRYDLFWRVLAYQAGYAPGDWADSISFDVLIDYDCCVGMRGNLDGDPLDSVTVADLNFLVAYLFQGGPLPDCIPEGNVNGSAGSETPDLNDYQYLADYLYNAGPPPVQCPGYICGDADGSGQIDAADAVFLTDYIYHGGPPPEPMDAGDMDCVPGVDEGDLDYLVDYLWEGGPAPCDCE
ncbi:MAG: hypothetical protein JSV52_09115 [Candidatus Zixiibacteriota bacterium]|nr:MAG: hypothetical protein JSV52_09115 [candidate division Zixibacteria bacterium]